MDWDGKNLRAISAFESFEWTPSVANDGRILYARWDYVDRFNGHFFSLWSTSPDGTGSQLVYGNYTRRPQCVFEARPIPNSGKLVFTATAHHSVTGGSLCLLDRTRGTEFDRPITRLTPEVPFPEAERNVGMYYAGPYPLSEEYFLVGWSDRRLPSHKLMWDDDPQNPRNAMGINLYDAFGNLALLHRDPKISSMNPIPVRPRRRPPILPERVDWAGPQEGRFLVQDVYRGLDGVARGAVKRLRIVAVAPKPQPQKNVPVLGVSKEEPGKFVNYRKTNIMARIFEFLSRVPQSDNKFHSSISLALSSRSPPLSSLHSCLPSPPLPSLLSPYRQSAPAQPPSPQLPLPPP